MGLPALTVPIQLVWTVRASDHDSEVLSAYVRVEPHQALGPESGRLTLVVEAEINRAAFAGGVLFMLDLQVGRDSGLLQGVRTGRVHVDCLFGTTKVI